MQKICNVYEVTDLNGDVVARGFAQDVADVIGCTKANVNYLSKQEGLFKSKFRINMIGRKTKYYGKAEGRESEWVITNEAETFVERYADLYKHGNTIMSQAEYKRHKQLIEDKGYRVLYRKIRHGRTKAYYIVEVF